MMHRYSQGSIDAQKRAERAVRWAQEAIALNMQAIEVNRHFHRVFLQQPSIDRSHHLFREKYAELQRALDAEHRLPLTRIHKLKVALLHEKAQCHAIDTVCLLDPEHGLFAVQTN